MSSQGPTDPQQLESSSNSVPSTSNFTNIDMTRRPQDDFYTYVNGLWLDTFEIPKDKSSYGAFAALRDQTEQQVKTLLDELLAANPQSLNPENRKIVDLYHAFMDTAALENRKFSPIQQLLQNIANISDTGALSSTMASLKQCGVKLPFGLYVGIDPKADNAHMLVMSQSGLGLPDREYYLSSEEKYISYQEKYRQHIANMLSLAGFKNTNELAVQIYEFEKQIALTHWKRADCRDVDKTYNKYQLAELKDNIGAHFNWSEFLTDIGVEAKEVCIRQPEALAGFDQLFHDTPIEIWKAYLAWQTIHAFAPYLHQAVTDENFNFYGRTLNDVPEQRDRYKRAISLIDDVVGESMGKLYVSRYFTPEAKQKMEQLVQHLKEAFKHGIMHASWMEPATKEAALLKLDSMTVKVGYPDQWRDYSALNIQADDLIGNIIRSNIFDFKFSMDKLYQPVNRDEWLMLPHEVNAYNMPPLNDICFPAGILQAPFFSLDASDAMNFGGIGAVIAHEMGHGFDDQGRKYDHHGHLREWWTESDAKEYQRRTDLIVEQYNAFEPLPGLHVNGKLTLGENVADLTGLSMALRAYKIAHQEQQEAELSGFTPKQQVFLNYAQIWRSKYREGGLRSQVNTDPHSPGIYRCNGIVSNLNSFHKAFQVKEEDPMYRDTKKRVQLWK